MSTAVWWIRRDLRLADNPVLQAALQAGNQVIPLFILDPSLLNSKYVGEKRLAFLYAGLQALDEELRRRRSSLIVRQGNPMEVLTRLRNEVEIPAIFAEPDYSPFAARRDRQIVETLPIVWLGNPAILPPGSVVKPDGSPYSVFTPFSKAWKASPHLPGRQNTAIPERIATPPELFSEKNLLNRFSGQPLKFAAGEKQAREQLERFMAASEGTQDASPVPVHEYADNRNRLDLEGTSRLSPYLRFGMISPRKVAAETFQAIESAPGPPARKGAETWLNELIWRDFYIHILAEFPHVRKRNFKLPDVKWENDAVLFEAWKSGQTGYPIVDAAMRQLAAEGWMHNRARMIVASFLTKDLLIDWRWGEEWFMRQLVDGDPAANNGGWQWTAGTGTDAAPYFRIFNPVLQGIRFDPEARMARDWLPELDGLPKAYLHEPWKAPLSVQQSAGVIIGKKYPSPVVDHQQVREKTLRAYRS